MVLHLIAIEPSSVAERDERVPRKAPIGVLATPTTQTSANQIHPLIFLESLTVTRYFQILVKAKATDSLSSNTLFQTR